MANCYQNKDTVKRKFAVMMTWGERALLVHVTWARDAQEACVKVMGKEYDPKIHYAIQRS